MKYLEKTIAAIIIAVFVLLILFINYEDETQVYDCTQLHKHQYVPERVIEECFKNYQRPIKSIVI